MSDINNAGGKGYFLMGLLIAFFLFVLLLIYLYQQNFTYLPS